MLIDYYLRAHLHHYQLTLSMGNTLNRKEDGARIFYFTPNLAIHSRNATAIIELSGNVSYRLGEGGSATVSEGELSELMRFIYLNKNELLRTLYQNTKNGNWEVNSYD